MEVTRKIYYEDPNQESCTATVVHREYNKVIFDQSVLFPEGGGQLADKGTVDGFEVRNVIKMGGKVVRRPDLPSINNLTQVAVVVGREDADQFSIGDVVEMKVDMQHRFGCSVHHSLVHLLMSAIWKRDGRDAFTTKGCRITPNEARIDLRTELKFDDERTQDIVEQMQIWIADNHRVLMEEYTGVPEVFHWSLDSEPSLSQPCGGTHVAKIGDIGAFEWKRRSKGKGLIRFYLSSNPTEIAELASYQMSVPVNVPVTVNPVE